VKKILVVDDEQDLCEILRFNLESEGFAVDCASSAEEALRRLEQSSYSLILLDVMLEAMSGFEMARHLRAAGNEIPIIFLTALNTEPELLLGFESGGDDYVTKPFSFQTVLARVKAVLKRTESHTTTPPIPATLTKKEHAILQLLKSHPGQYFTREQILQAVWDDDTYVGDRSVDVHIARLRKKLGDNGRCIGNRTGFGYYYTNNEAV
jgi:DNA-binding response OmpR family regulator